MKDNPLPDSFIITLTDPNKASSVALSVSSISNIDKVLYGKEELEKILNATYVIRISSVVIISILLFISIFIISNTIKLTVFARRREIGIMKYVGATDWFVRGPFIIEGILLGIPGSLISSGILGAGYILYRTAGSDDRIHVTVTNAFQSNYAESCHTVGGCRYSDWRSGKFCFGEKIYQGIRRIRFNEKSDSNTSGYYACSNEYKRIRKQCR